MNKTSSITHTIKSVLFAFLGVQSNESRERDFSQGKLSHFIAVGVIAVILFIVTLISIVSFVIE